MNLCIKGYLCLLIHRKSLLFYRSEWSFCCGLSVFWSIALPPSWCCSCGAGSWRWCSSCQLRHCSYNHPSKGHARCSPVTLCMIYWWKCSSDHKDSPLGLHSNMQFLYQINYFNQGWTNLILSIGTVLIWYILLSNDITPGAFPRT